MQVFWCCRLVCGQVPFYSHPRFLQLGARPLLTSACVHAPRRPHCPSHVRRAGWRRSSRVARLPRAAAAAAGSGEGRCVGDGGGHRPQSAAVRPAVGWPGLPHRHRPERRHAGPGAAAGGAAGAGGAHAAGAGAGEGAACQLWASVCLLGSACWNNRWDSHAVLLPCPPLLRRRMWSNCRQRWLGNSSTQVRLGMAAAADLKAASARSTAGPTKITLHSLVQSRPTHLPQWWTPSACASSLTRWQRCAAWLPAYALAAHCCCWSTAAVALARWQPTRCGSGTAFRAWLPCSAHAWCHVCKLAFQSCTHAPWIPQDLTAPAVAATGKGCRWNDDVPGLVAAAGLQVQRVEPHVGGLIVSLSAVKPAQPA